MEDDGRVEAAREEMVPPSTFDAELLSEIRCLEAFYEESEGLRVSPEALSYYSDYLTEKDKDEFLMVPASDLDYFCSNRNPSWLRNLLSDAVVFSKLHNTWEVYICPSNECLCWFKQADSLVLHLINEHSIALPFLRRSLTDEGCCSTVFCDTVWKPIDVRVALNTLSTISLDSNGADSCLDADHLASLEWPLSEDCRRIELLAALQRVFEMLLGSRDGDSYRLLTNGFLRALIAVASQEILRRLDPTNILPLPFRALLYRSPLSFRFMEEESLCCFLELVEGMCNLVEGQASQNSELEGSQEGDMNWSKSEFHNAVSFPAGCDYFVLDQEELNACGIDENRMGSWLFEAPIFPIIKKLPTKASEILQLAENKAISFSECLKTICAQSDLNLAALTSCLKMWSMGHWPISLLDKSSHQLAANSESNSTNGMLSPSCYSVREPSRWRTEFDYQHYLKLIKCTCELQSFELQVRRLCKIDLRVYILPLLKSYLRMKMYMFIRVGYGYEMGDAEEEAAYEGRIMEGSQEEHSEEHAHRPVEGKIAADGGSDVMMPDLSSYKRSEQLSTSPPGLRSSGSSASGLSNLDAMVMDIADALLGEQPSANGGETDSRASQVESADAAPFRSRIGMAAVIAESEATIKSDAKPELKTEPKPVCSQEFIGPLWYYFDMYSDSDIISQSGGEYEDGGCKMEAFSDVAWKTSGNGLFISMTITDVVKHCLQQTSSHEDALIIWGLKTKSTPKYWCCFWCCKLFPDEKSHKLHMESRHCLEFPWIHDWLVPSRVQQEGHSGVNEGIKERTYSLDDSITVDSTHRTFIVEMEKFESSYQNEKGRNDQNVSQFQPLIVAIRKQIRHLVHLVDSKRCLASKIGELNAEIVENFDLINKMKQELSDLCVQDCMREISIYISSFMQKRNLMDSMLRLWALERLNVLLRSVRCPWHPDSFSIELTSPGKVIVNIEEYNAWIRFSYVGICWKFAGDLSCTGSRDIKGIFMFSGASTSDDGLHFDRNVILDKEYEMTKKMFYFRTAVERHLTLDLLGKLHQFQDEFRARLQCQERGFCLYGLGNVLK